MRVADPICPTCKRTQGAQHVATTKAPCMATLERWAYDGIARATDGCVVEPDGYCPHGHQSWILRLGMV